MKQLIALLSMMVFATSVFAADPPKKETKPATTKKADAPKKADVPKKDLGTKPTPKKKAEKPAEPAKK